MSQSFIIDEKVQEQLEKQDQMDLAFINLADGKPLILNLYAQTEGKIMIRTDNMEVAGDVIQDLCSFMNIAEMESTADFPIEMEDLKGVIKKVNDFNEVRLHLAADMADSIRNAKTFIVKAEDARILGDMYKYFRKG
jgi:Bardet-Biedl syndrome 2 protein